MVFPSFPGVVGAILRSARRGGLRRGVGLVADGEEESGLILHLVGWGHGGVSSAKIIARGTRRGDDRQKGDHEQGECRVDDMWVSGLHYKVDGLG